jgi:LDH2 family malate/lactate/ureidoglycolate dehydrogenase
MRIALNNALQQDIFQKAQLCRMSGISDTTQVIGITELQQFSEDVFIALGCREADARLAAEVLISADKRGVDSHGIARLSGYARLVKNGRVNTNPQMRIIHESPSTATADGDAGLGLVIAPQAMRIAIGKAKTCGTGWVSVCNSNHFGIAGYHAMLALEEDMIGIAMTNASAFVAPTFSTERLLGTNPIAVAVPSGREAPFIADFATTTASNGKLEILQRNRSKAPLGWVQDQDGNPSDNAAILKEGGALLPLGSDKEHGSHKGYALGSIVDILSGVLSGGNYGPWVPPFPAYALMPQDMPGKGIGHFFGAMRIDAFRSAAAFKEDMDRWLKRFRSAQPAAGQKRVLVPGDAERDMEKERAQYGVPLPQALVEELTALANEWNIPHPF